MKKAFKIIGILILILILFRGIIFRLVIKYDEIGTRPKIEITNQNLIEKIESTSINRPIDVKNILEIADKITKKELKFTTNRASSNPNELINTNQANCVGYSAMFNSIANYLIRKHNLQNKIEAKHKIGQLRLLGINLHQFFDSSFFADHDFNEVIHKGTNEVISIDPTVSDYLKIKRVNNIH